MAWHGGSGLGMPGRGLAGRGRERFTTCRRQSSGGPAHRRTCAGSTGCRPPGLCRRIAAHRSPDGCSGARRPLANTAPVRPQRAQRLGIRWTMLTGAAFFTVAPFAPILVAQDVQDSALRHFDLLPSRQSARCHTARDRRDRGDRCGHGRGAVPWRRGKGAGVTLCAGLAAVLPVARWCRPD